MNKSRTMSAFTVGAVLFALVSVILCVTFNKGSYSANVVVEKKWDVQLQNVSDVIYSGSNFCFIYLDIIEVFPTPASPNKTTLFP